MTENRQREHRDYTGDGDRSNRLDRIEVRHRTFANQPGRHDRSKRRSASLFIALAAAALTFTGEFGTNSPAAANAADDITTAATASGGAVRDRLPRTFAVVATGDILTENAVMRTAAGAAAGVQRYNFDPLFAPISPMIHAADLAICHMEIPIGQPGQRPGVYGRSPFGGNLLLAPYELADGIRRAGFDRCTTASNHSYDLGVGGIDSTLGVLDEAGLTHVGTARTEAESAPRVFEVNGVRVAHLSWTRYSNTARPVAPWRLNFASTSRQVAEDVDTARANGAEVVLLSIHVSKEMLTGPTPQDRAFVTDITAAAKVDLVIQHGPHVVQPLELVNGTWVYWSLGNLLSGMGWAQTGRYADPRTMDGLLASATITETSPGVFAVEAVPILLCDERVSRVIYPAAQTLARPGLDVGLRNQLAACVDRTIGVVPDIR